MNLESILIVLLFLWAAVLTVVFGRFYFYYTRLIRGGKKDSIVDLLNDILHHANATKEDLDELRKRCDTLETDGALHIQKVGLARFNPFKETGGDQSFILALLNRQDSGVVISSLHTRSGTRWYAKRVARGKGLEHELSAEEEKAVAEAKS